jgi:cell division septation protein DedD
MAANETEEFEFVLGRRQMASMGVVALSALAAFTAFAYVIGKSATAATPPPAPAPVHTSAPVAAPQPKPAEAPIFGETEHHRTYVQVASVERGYAVLMAHGARKAGFPAFVADGPRAGLYRVIAGPFSSAADARIAQSAFTNMGLETFTKKSNNEPAVTTTPDEPAAP